MTPPPSKLLSQRGKLRLTLVPWEFVEAMARNLEDGLADHPEREPDDWKDIPSHFVDGPYRSALLRHYGRREWAAVAVNAAILFWHDRKKTDRRNGNT